ncbi:hypothetical protein [Streptomyces sp. SID3343]|uniref:hypothetical protein n=1 Tax=Streptomyces sp. SID3343 TaxID=2690260 RepID=UPI0013698827|nr:hypothetical protein [Streptomyces sp. SID3343]MYW03371.1 hypothetical protein [Streptomyces sp. SID3343]MYW06223.1 hypothetical protein [Streptomyces sp. SID3343]
MNDRHRVASVRHASPAEKAAAQDPRLRHALDAIASVAVARLPIPFHWGGSNLDRADMIELGRELWGADEMREALTTAPGQKVTLCLRRQGDVLVVRHPTDPDTFLVACLAPTSVNLDHDWTHDPHAPAVLRIPADPHRAVDAIATHLLPQQQAAVTALRQAAVAGGTEVVVGIDRTWPHPGRLTAHVTDTAPWNLMHDLEYHGLTTDGDCVYALRDWDLEQANHLVEHLQECDFRVRRDHSLPPRGTRTSAGTTLAAPHTPSASTAQAAPATRPSRFPRA